MRGSIINGYVGRVFSIKLILCASFCNRVYIYLKIPLNYNSFNSNDPSIGLRFDTMYVVWVDLQLLAFRPIGLMTWPEWCLKEGDFSFFTALVRGVSIIFFLIRWVIWWN